MQEELKDLEENIEDDNYDMKSSAGVVNWFADYAKQFLIEKRLKELEVESKKQEVPDA